MIISPLPALAVRHVRTVASAKESECGNTGLLTRSTSQEWEPGSVSASSNPQPRPKPHPVQDALSQEEDYVGQRHGKDGGGSRTARIGTERSYVRTEVVWRSPSAYDP